MIVLATARQVLISFSAEHVLGKGSGRKLVLACPSRQANGLKADG